MEDREWRQIETIFHRALDLDAREREKYLAHSCAGDAFLLEEVESLIAASQKDAAFMDEPVFNNGLKVLHGGKVEKSLAGKTVGFYEIKRKLGEGGMGSVYLAEDSRLNRPVALKFLTDTFADDKWARKQLLKEARALANLDHQNVCVVHGIEEIGEHRFIVMQYIEGETLAALIQRRAIATNEILNFARQIAEAVAAAHAYGIIHRDIKPANVIVAATNGQAKVLDFGLAKSVHHEHGETPAANNALRIALEQPADAAQKSRIIGTIAYMSPEQLRGERLDFATDVFSFGILLCELVGGRNPFVREDNEKTIAAIFGESPAPFKSPTGAKIPAKLELLIGGCLEKDRRNRYQSMSEVLLDLNAVSNKKPPAASFDYLKKFWLAPVVVLLVLFGIAGYFRAGKTQRIAVLPIVNRSADGDFDFIGDGLTESLINRIAGSSKLAVKPYTNVVGVGGENRDYAQIGKSLGVDKILAGTIVARDGETFLKNNLISAADGAILWSAETPLTIDDSLAAEEQIARKVIAQIEYLANENVKKSDERRRSTKNQEAFNYYLKGRYFWSKRNKENIAKAIEAYSKAVEADPTFAQAYAGLADAFVVQSGVAYGSVSTTDTMPKAKFAAKQAMEIDDSLAESHAALAVVSGKYDWDWAAAETEFKRAVELNPEYSQAHYWYSEMLSTAGRTDEALAEANRARELDPFSPLMDMNVGRVLYLGRRYDDALANLNQTLVKNPSNTKAKYLVGLVHIQTGAYREALDVFEQLRAGGERDLTAAALGYTLAKIGRKPEALEILAEMNDDSQINRVPPQEKAIVLIGLGDKEAALRWLNLAFNEHLSTLSSLKSEPLFDDLRGERKFANLLEQMNFKL